MQAQQCGKSLFTIQVHSGVSKISFRGGGGFKIFLEKYRIFAWRLLRGFGGMLPREKFLKWCNLVRFGE